MGKAIFRSPILVWPAFMLLAVIVFPFSLWPELRSAFYYAYLDSFASAADHARKITARQKREQSE